MKSSFITFIIFICCLTGYSQNVSINNDGSLPDASAILDVKSSTKGLLIPRLTLVQRNAVATPATGLLIFQTDNSPGYYYYTGLAWTAFTGSGYWSLNGTDIFSSYTGNIGIGTNTPLRKLTVQTASNSYGLSQTDGTRSLSTYIGDETNGNGAFFGTETNHPLYFFTNSSAPLMTLTTAGNVGIGTRTPSSRLTVQSLTNDFGLTHTDGTVTVGSFIGNFQGATGGWLGTKSAHPLNFFTSNGAAQMTLSTNGNFGIGTVTPLEKLTIQTPEDSYGISHRTNTGKVLATLFGGTSAGIGTFSNTAMRIFSNSVSRMLISPTGDVSIMGNVGIGVESLNARFQIGNIFSPLLYGIAATHDFGIAGVNGGILVIDQQPNGTIIQPSTDIILMPRVNGHGRVGINTATPGYPLEVADDILSPSYNHSFFSVSIQGNIYSGATVASANVSIYAARGVMGAEFDAFSDARIKDIKGISSSKKDLETINALQITDYTLKDKIKYGNKSFKKVIAQEVEKVYPQVVSQHADFIPNVYQLTNKIEQTPNGLLLSFVGDHHIGKKAKKLRVLLPAEENMKSYDIISVPYSNQVIINAPAIKSDKVFVYGEEVDDFRTIDYEGLAILNISATQEISKLLTQQEKAIKMQNKKIEEMAATIELLKRKSTIKSKAD